MTPTATIAVRLISSGNAPAPPTARSPAFSTTLKPCLPSSASSSSASASPRTPRVNRARGTANPRSTPSVRSKTLLRMLLATTTTMIAPPLLATPPPHQLPRLRRMLLALPILCLRHPPTVLPPLPWRQPARELPLPLLSACWLTLSKCRGEAWGVANSAVPRKKSWQPAMCRTLVPGWSYAQTYFDSTAHFSYTIQLSDMQRDTFLMSKEQRWKLY